MSNLPYHSRHTGAEVDDAVDRLNILWDVNSRQMSGSEELASGVSSGSVTGLALPFWPAKIFLQVEAPVGGFVLFSTVVVGSMSPDGFSYELSGNTDSELYRLHYLIIGEEASSNDSNQDS